MIFLAYHIQNKDLDMQNSKASKKNYEGTTGVFIIDKMVL